jgi:hypothetical protein
VDIVNAAPPAASSLRFGLPTINPNRFVDSGGDGRFEFHGIRPGSYTVKASYSALYSESKNIVVADQPLESVDFILRAATLSGRILDESGSPIPEVQLFGDVVVSTVSNPNIIASTIFHIAVTALSAAFSKPRNIDSFFEHCRKGIPSSRSLRAAWTL